jgi:hypothetical protein
MGCREFAARFETASETDVPLPVSEDLGPMLYDIIFRPEGNRPIFFSARLENGIMNTPTKTMAGIAPTRDRYQIKRPITSLWFCFHVPVCHQQSSWFQDHPANPAFPPESLSEFNLELC